MEMEGGEEGVESVSKCALKHLHKLKLTHGRCEHVCVRVCGCVRVCVRLCPLER